MKKTKMLKKNYEFRNVLTRGKYYSGKYLVAFITKNKGSGNFLGIAVSSKVSNAVKRNYIKRLIREIYQQEEMIIKPDITIVFLCKKKANLEEINYKNLKEDIKQILKKSESIGE